MAGLTQRLDRLEQRLSDEQRRCDVCRARSGCAVVFESDGDDTPCQAGDADACPACGWRPTVIHVRFVEAPLGAL